MDIQSLKKECDRYFDENCKDQLWTMAQDIFEHPEIAYNEYHACKLQVDYLKKEGFKVEEKAGGLDTAFMARYGQGKPVIAIFSEYDALPELGHACGHNIISTSALGAGMIAKKFLDETKHEGTLIIAGTPAEESGGGKIEMLKNGCFNDIDAIITQHPTTEPTRLSGDCLGSACMEIDFYGHPAQAGSHPDQGINALHAAEIFDMMVNFRRQHFKADWRTNTYIKQDDITIATIAEHVKVTANVACFSNKDLRYLIQMIHDCAQSAAKGMGCTMTIKTTEGYQGRISNKVLSDVCRKEFEDLGEPLMDGMPIDYGGEDLGNVSRVIPACQCFATLFPEHKISGHSVKFRELCNSPAALHNLEVSSKAMGRSCMEYFLHPEIIEAAKAELAARMEKEK